MNNFFSSQFGCIFVFNLRVFINRPSNVHNEPALCSPIRTNEQHSFCMKFLSSQSILFCPHFVMGIIYLIQKLPEIIRGVRLFHSARPRIITTTQINVYHVQTNTNQPTNPLVTSPLFVTSKADISSTLCAEFARCQRQYTHKSFIHFLFLISCYVRLIQ